MDQLGGGSGVGEGRHFIAEACEYDRSFLKLSPKCAAILNIEEDHLDYYKNISAIEEAFGEFAARVPDSGLLVVNGRDERCVRVAEQATARVETFGDSPDCAWQYTDLYATNGHYSFNVWRAGQKLGRATLGPAAIRRVTSSESVLITAMKNPSWNPYRATQAYPSIDRWILQRKGVRNGIFSVDKRKRPRGRRLFFSARLQS